MTDGARMTGLHLQRARPGPGRDHTARGHELPVSNGYRINRGEVVVYCGWCRGIYRPSRDWANRYLSALWRGLASSARSEQSRITARYARNKIADVRAEFRRAGLRATFRLPPGDDW